MKRSSGLATADLHEVALQRLTHHVGQHDPPILLSFPAADSQLPALEVDVFDSERQTLLEPQARAIQQRADEFSRCALS